MVTHLSEAAHEDVCREKLEVALQETEPAPEETHDKPSSKSDGDAREQSEQPRTPLLETVTHLRETHGREDDEECAVVRACDRLAKRLAFWRLRLGSPHACAGSARSNKGTTTEDMCATAASNNSGNPIKDGAYGNIREQM